MYDMYLLTDKIFEFAPRWFPTTCDHEEEEEDWDTEDKQEQPTEPEVDSVSTMFDNVPTIDDDSTIFQHIRSSATGAPINITDTKIASLTTVVRRYLLRSSKHHLGTFSHLLIAALEQLIKNYELRKSASGIFVTKLELRTPNVNSFLIRKIYITPSTVFYEGPYCEEKCAVTRTFEEYQDRFLRVTFRDEGIEQDKLIFVCCLLFT
jgi:hypothetical protein